MNRKLVALLLAAVMSLGMVGCGSKSEEAEVPATEVTEDEMIAQTGIDLQAMDGAENVTYSVLSTDPVIAQMTFTYDGHDFTERACATDLTEFSGTEIDADAESIEGLTGIDFNSGNISGLDCEFTLGATQVVAYRDAIYQGRKNGPEYIAWLDTVPGILYNLSCQDSLTEAELVEYAEAVFLPMQGDAE